MAMFENWRVVPNVRLYLCVQAVVSVIASKQCNTQSKFVCVAASEVDRPGILADLSISGVAQPH